MNRTYLRAAGICWVITALTYLAAFVLASVDLIPLKVEVVLLSAGLVSYWIGVLLNNHYQSTKS